MLIRLGIPKTLQWVLNLLLIFLIMFTFYRLLTLVAFGPEELHWNNLFYSFLLGLRFDLRWISLLLLPIVTASLIPRLSPFYSATNKKAWTLYLAVITFLVFFFFAADFGCFSYNKTRLNASALNFVEDPRISITMLWQSYPLLWMILGLILAVVLLRWMFKKLHRFIVIKTEGRGIRYNRKWFVLATLAFSMLIYGSLNVEPLKWNAAFRFNDSFESYLALNPLQNFFTTLKFRTPQFSAENTRKSFKIMAGLMDFPMNQSSYKRIIEPGNEAVKSQPNVVLVLCESFSMYKSSMSGNPLNTTPFFKSMCDSGIFFNHCFTPHFSTARGLFATLTGIPDVQLSKFSSRNIEALDQHTIINNFNNYNKFYFLGGNPSFNNFEGLVTNINGIQMNTQAKFQDKSLNVWGISDKDLFNEANSTFSKQKKPFFAIVQTADNHRPYNIPKDEKDFQINDLPDSTLKTYGFESNEEFNAFRYSDYCFRNFIEKAKKESYFDNTIFVFVGDHGVSGNAKNIYPSVWNDERLTEEHVPLLFYAPKLLCPQKKEEVVSQIDVLPTIAGISGQTYTNTTLGRDVISTKNKNHYAFIILHDEGRIGLITDRFYFTKNLNFNKEELFDLKLNEKLPTPYLDSIKNSMSAATTAYYETAKWMLVHNKKSN
ncbi:MAG TPA: sulfatase-like hydrolase/transferase [Flavisolibacter sp.]|nr:sulfatase-like hydrolase/transferase [Flavisolibacter sp.]